jgi:pimeloyl-ACP methyl ester carboxylesterase
MNKNSFKILFLLLFAINSYVFSQDTTYYKGDLKINDANQMPITLKIIQQKDTTLYFLGSPSQTQEYFPASKVKHYGDTLSIGIKQLGVVIKGLFNNDKTVFNSTFKQGLMKTDIAFIKTKQAFSYNRPQTPKPPFDYNIEELTFKTPSCDYIFHGTLTYPKTNKKYPLVVLVTGSGLENRDEEIFSHKPFAVIADYFAKNGIATFRYDDRGFGQKDTLLMKGTTLDFALDCESAIKMLKDNEHIDKNHIGVVGHSEGGLIAEVIASRNKDVSFIVLLAAPSITGKDIMISQTKKILASNGASKEDIDKNVNEINAMTFNDNSINDIWTKCFYYLDPKDYLKKIKCPTLVLNGSKDMQVIPEENIPYMQKYLTNKPTIKVMPNLNHLFQHCTTGNPSEYINIEETFSPEVLQIMRDFILQQK